MDRGGRRWAAFCGQQVGDEIVNSRGTRGDAVERMPSSSRRPTDGAGADGAVVARPTVIVVGAGVSGCACAAALATSGLHVTLVNSAMDRVGLPAYGPDLLGGDEGWSRLQEALDGLSSPLREVWIGAAARPANGAAILNIDRRRISIETKRALETISGLDFRQGFVTDLRMIDPDTSGALGGGFGEGAGEAPTAESAVAGDALGRSNAVQIETVFGEVFAAQAVVVAAGLSLDASTLVGAGLVQGGRYGEPSSDGLWAALKALGAEFRETVVEVGPRVSIRDAAAAGWLPANAGDGAPGPPVEALVALVREGEAGSWPVDYPPAAHWDSGLRTEWMVTRPVGGEQAAFRRETPVLSPDGGATAELYVASQSALLLELADDARAAGALAASDTPAAADAAGSAGDVRTLVATRMPSTTAGKVLTGLSGSGRLTHGGRPCPVWVVGRAAGAQDYAASLISGVRAAADVGQVLGLRVVVPAVAETSVRSLLGSASGSVRGEAPAPEGPGGERKCGGTT
jgi:hypothetical protein